MALSLPYLLYHSFYSVPLYTAAVPKPNNGIELNHLVYLLIFLNYLLALTADP
nr:MAG TPA: hypothetical protein [Caudoviricetes sp.]